MTYDSKAYRRGWDAGVRGSDTALERADDRNEPSAWYDGYADAAAGREKYHLRECAGCPDHPAEQAEPEQGDETQVCTGCGRDKPLTEYGRTSAARGNKPMRRCKVCIQQERQARVAKRAADAQRDQRESTAKVKGKGKSKGKSQRSSTHTAKEGRS